MSPATRDVQILRQKQKWSQKGPTHTSGQIWDDVGFRVLREPSAQAPHSAMRGFNSAGWQQRGCFWEGRIDLPSGASKPAYRRAGIMPAGGRAQGSCARPRL